MSEGIEFNTAGITKKLMYVNRKAPYGTIYALEVLEAVLIYAASFLWMTESIKLKKDKRQTVST